MTRFNIERYVGATPVKFGMHQAEIHQLLGPPKRSVPIWDKSGYSDFYTDDRFNVGYDNAWCVTHAGFGPGRVTLSIEGKVLWTEEYQPDPNLTLLALDPEPIEDVGFWIFLKLGVTTTGYHDEDPGQYSVCVFPTGACDKLIAKARPADTGKYTTRLSQP